MLWHACGRRDATFGRRTCRDSVPRELHVRPAPLLQDGHLTSDCLMTVVGSLVTRDPETIARRRLAVPEYALRDTAECG